MSPYRKTPHPDHAEERELQYPVGIPIGSVQPHPPLAHLVSRYNSGRDAQPQYDDSSDKNDT